MLSHFRFLHFFPLVIQKNIIFLFESIPKIKMLQNVIVKLQLQYSDWLIGQTLKWEFKKQRKRTKNNPPKTFLLLCHLWDSWNLHIQHLSNQLKPQLGKKKKSNNKVVSKNLYVLMMLIREALSLILRGILQECWCYFLENWLLSRGGWGVHTCWSVILNLTYSGAG